MRKKMYCYIWLAQDKNYLGQTLNKKWRKSIIKKTNPKH